MKWRSAIALLAAATSAAQAFTPGGLAPRPGYLDHDSDMRWRFFRETNVTADQAKGDYRAEFSPFLTRVDGTKFSISGFMLPLDANRQTRHFVLTRRNASCPFCPPNEPTEAIEVFSERPVTVSNSAIIVEGQLRLVGRSSQGLFFQLDRARLL